MFPIIIKTENLYILEAMNVLVWNITYWLFFCQTISAVLLVHLQVTMCFECKNLQFNKKPQLSKYYMSEGSELKCYFL